jgi:hypothetical protein
MSFGRCTSSQLAGESLEHLSEALCQAGALLSRMILGSPPLTEDEFHEWPV